MLWQDLSFELGAKISITPLPQEGRRKEFWSSLEWVGEGGKRASFVAALLGVSLRRGLAVARN